MDWALGFGMGTIGLLAHKLKIIELLKIGPWKIYKKDFFFWNIENERTTKLAR